jgi:hypothetical protein
MAISIRATGAYTNIGNAGSLTPAIPAGATAGDMMLCFVGCKEYNSVQTINQGWSLIGLATDGTIASNTDVGSMRITAFYKVHSGSEINPTVTGSNNENVTAVIIVFQKGAGVFWNFPAGAGGGDTTAGTGFSVTASTNFGITANDMVIGYAALRSDSATQSSIAISATGVTFGTFTESPATDAQNSNRDQMAMSGGYRLATAGTSTAAPVYTATLAGSHTGSAFMVRLRESATDVMNASFDPMGMMGFFGI